MRHKPTLEAIVGRATWVLDGVGELHRSRWGKWTMQIMPIITDLNG